MSLDGLWACGLLEIRDFRLNALQARLQLREPLDRARELKEFGTSL